MNQNAKIKLIVAIVLFGLSVVFFSLAVQKYQVYINSRANEGLSPTPSPTVTPTPSLPISSRAGFTDIPNVDDHTYTPPLPLDQVTDEMKEAHSQRGGYCSIDNKECTGWAWRFVCNVSPNIVWEPAGSPDWTPFEAEQYYTRWCTRHTGTTKDIKVKFERLDEPEDGDQVYKLDDVGCGKLVQIDVTVKNCEPGIDYDDGDDCDSGGGNIRDALVYYTGACPVPTASPSATLTATPQPTETPSATPIPTETPTGTLTPSATPTITLTPTLTLTPTVTQTPTATPIPTETPVPTQTPTATLTPIPTETPIATATLPPAPTWTPGPQATYTPQPTYTPPPAPTSLVVNNQAPGITPWMVVLLPIGLVLIGLFL